MLLAAPLMSLVPLAALGAVLAVVCWNMADKHEFLALSRASVGDALVLFATFLLTIFVDLTTGIVTYIKAGVLQPSESSPLLGVSPDRAKPG